MENRGFGALTILQITNQVISASAASILNVLSLHGLNHYTTRVFSLSNKGELTVILKMAKTPPPHYQEEETKNILGGGQFPNYANVKQSAAKIAFKHQLQSHSP